MSGVELPALRSDDPLGYLAALGVLRIASRFGEARLAWRGIGDVAAVVVDGVSDVDGVVDVLHRFALDLAGPVERSKRGKVSLPEAVVFDPVDRDMLMADDGPIDPYAFTAPSVLDLRLAAHRDELAGRRARGEWVPALLAVDDANEANFTELYKKYTGPTGLVSSLTKRLHDVVTEPELLREALVSWRRVDGCYGDNLDHRSIGDSGVRPDGETFNAAVPGAMWLALMALPMFPMTASPAATSGWCRVERRNRMVLPVWSDPLAVSAVAALVRHPAVVRADPDPDGCRALGLSGVVGVDRISVGRAVPLGPSQILWAP